MELFILASLLHFGSVADSFLAEIITWLFVLLVFGGPIFYAVKRQQRMKEISEEPETAEERKARFEIPSGLKRLANEELKKEVLEDLKIAGMHLETAEETSKNAVFWSWMDVADLEAGVGGVSNKQESMADMMNELMHADKHMTRVWQCLRLLREKGAKETASFSDFLEIGMLDIVVDHPLTDLLTLVKLKELQSRIIKDRETAVALRGKLSAAWKMPSTP